MSGACKFALDEQDVAIWGVRVGPNDETIRNRDEKRTVNFPHPKGECSTCLMDSGLKMKCGDFICPDDILDQAWNQIKQLKHEISCTVCPSIISTDDIIKFGLPNVDEKQFLIAAISVNYCESQGIQLCPGCHSYCQRIDNDRSRVICTICTRNNGKNYEFCWHCLREWKNSGNMQICGYSDCRREEIELLRASPKTEIKDSKGKIALVPKIRACPKCSTIIQHNGGCNEMTCKKCNEKFCFICLTPNSAGSLKCKSDYQTFVCTPAPIQTKLKEVNNIEKQTQQPPPSVYSSCIVS